MIRKLAVILAILIVGYFALVVLSTGHIPSIFINGRPIAGPFNAIAGVLGFAISVLVLLFVGILLTLIFAGVGLIVLGSLGVVALILAVVAFPFLLPLLIPLFILWLICCLVRAIRVV